MCVCKKDTASIGKDCVPLAILVPAIVVPLTVLLGVAVAAYVRYLFAKRDAVWTIKRSEIDFGITPTNPVEVPDFALNPKPC